MREINPWEVAVRGDSSRAALTGLENDIYELAVFQLALEMGGLMNYFICQWGRAIHQVLAFLQRVEAPNADALAAATSTIQQKAGSLDPEAVDAWICEWLQDDAAAELFDSWESQVAAFEQMWAAVDRYLRAHHDAQLSWDPVPER